jgi:hypothetical protein
MDRMGLRVGILSRDVSKFGSPFPFPYLVARTNGITDSHDFASGTPESLGNRLFHFFYGDSTMP